MLESAATRQVLHRLAGHGNSAETQHLQLGEGSQARGIGIGVFAIVKSEVADIVRFEGQILHPNFTEAGQSQCGRHDAGRVRLGNCRGGRGNGRNWRGWKMSGLGSCWLLRGGTDGVVPGNYRLSPISTEGNPESYAEEHGNA